jgi:hypothetical protein
MSASVFSMHFEGEALAEQHLKIPREIEVRTI